MTETSPLPREMAEYESFMMILFFLVAIPPAIGCFLQALPTLKYALSDKRHKEMVEELVIRRKENEVLSKEV